MEIKNAIEKKTKAAIVKNALELLQKNPEKNMELVYSIAKKGAKDDFMLEVLENLKKNYDEIESVKSFVHNVLENADNWCMEKFFTNIIGNALWYGIPRRKSIGEKNNVKIPFTILISPSMSCNLKCTGCYAANYDKSNKISYNEMDRIISEARELGIYYIVLLGGEPFINDYLFDLFGKYDDMYFMPFSNGTLFDEELADKLLKLGNVMPMFSMEGFEKETDNRRGTGMYEKVVEGMQLLKNRGVMFGVSTMADHNNLNTIVSDEFIDMIIDNGAQLLWYFMFMPVGNNPIKDMDLMLTPEERIRLGRENRRIRSTKPIFSIDFFNDAPYVGGCIAGKFYCHINSNEDIEPCIFSHFSSFNLKGKKLVEAFKAPFFKELRRLQPFNENLLMPCPMIDNPTQIRAIVPKNNAVATHVSAEAMIKDAEFMARIDTMADNFKIIADEAYEKDFKNDGNYKMSKG